VVDTDISDILKLFHPVSPYEGLADKLRKKMVEAKTREQGSDTVEQSTIDSFVKHIVDGVMKPHEHKSKLLDTEGAEHDITLKFYDDKCEIVSDLFPSPFFVVRALPFGAKGHTYLVNEFFGIQRILKAFDGKAQFK
jgi:hypothetical protein